MPLTLFAQRPQTQRVNLVPRKRLSESRYVRVSRLDLCDKSVEMTTWTCGGGHATPHCTRHA